MTWPAPAGAGSDTGAYARPVADETPTDGIDSSFDRRRLTALLVPVGILYVVGWVTTFTAPAILSRWPWLLLALSPSNRYLLLVIGAGIPAWQFFLIGFVRLVAFDPIFYALGYWYGDGALAWIDKTTQGNTGPIRWMQRWFAKAQKPIVAIMPNQWVCLFAGQARMPIPTFAVLNVVGTIGRLLLFWYASKPFRSQLEWVVDFITKYQWWFVIGLFAISFAQALRKAATGQLEPLSEVEDEIEAAMTDEEP